MTNKPIVAVTARRQIGYSCFSASRAVKCSEEQRDP